MNAKTIGTIIVGLGLIVSLAAWAGSQSAAQEPRLITVTGDADVRVMPDEVILTLGVETWDKDMVIAKSQNDERANRVLALAQSYGIEPKYIQTDHISIEPRYHSDNYSKGDLIGFFVRKNIVITLHDLSRFEDLLTSLLDAGTNYVHGIQFRTTELRQYKDQARALAINAAREKAEALAQELEQELGQPYTIREEYSRWWSWYGSWWGSSWGGGMAQNVVQNAEGDPWTTEGGLAPGQIAVNARVTVSFELK